MPLKDVDASSEQIAQFEASQERYKRARELAIKREEARMSDLRFYETPDGTTWHYVTLDGKTVRIIGCSTGVSRLGIPEAIEGLPVTELGVDCCSSLDSIEEVVCPECIERIGQAAFRRNNHLKRVVFPRAMDVFDYTWVRECPALRELVLPGMVEKLDASVFYSEGLRSLVIGPGTKTIVPGAFTTSVLEHIEVDADNDALRTDGQSLITRDGKTLVVFAVPTESYCVPYGCERIAKKAFSGHRVLKSVELPDTLSVIEPYGFARTGLSEFVAPPALERIEERAFYRCTDLENVVLNEGLVALGDYAFDGTALSALEAPSTIADIGVHIIADSIMAFGTSEAGFSIAPGATTLFLDEYGGLYRAREGGKHFVRMLDPNITEYEVAPGTRVIDERSFARHKKIKSVVLPEGVEVIDPNAFRDCSALEAVSLPETLRVIGEDAFLDTVLRSIELPASLERLGEHAIATRGAHRGDSAPSLREVRVAVGNERFYMDQGMLIERVAEGQLQVVLYTDTQSSVTIPREVTRICDYAFNGARRLRRFYINDGLRSVGMNGLSVASALELLHVDLVRPVKGHESFDLYFPPTDRSAHEIQLAFSTSSWVNIEKILRHYDNAIVNIHDYGVRAADVDIYGQTHRMLERLLDPIFMTKSHKSMYDHIITHNLERICVVAARNDDRRAIDALLELGYLNEDNLMGIIDAVGALQDAAMTGYLLEIKRRVFRRSAVDFEL